MKVWVQIDCAEYQESHEISKLIGSPLGNVGHGETQPVLTQEALNQWHTEKLKLSLLLDEIEKASAALWQLPQSILDRGSLTLGSNRHVDLSQTLIFMTSNLGASEMSGMIEGGIMKTVLFVDDNEVLCRLTCDILRLEGYHAVPAYNAPEALRVFDEENFDIVVTDVRMQGMSGLELARAIHNKNP